ncbi:MAG: hypothetical protein EXR11_07790, partial [Rhodospirillaceae bacterium]|nr:hypothetical protein [Rhodospirillaceae bacterium]
NHVQDCRADAENLKRCYIPLEWLNTAGIDLIDVFDPANLTNYGPGYTPIRDDYTHGDDELPSTSAKPLDQEKLSGCLNLMLNEAETLLQKAQGLPHLLRDRGLTAQSAAILHLAQRLLTLLRHDDPWNYRVSLRMIDWIGSAWVGLRMWIAHR